MTREEAIAKLTNMMNHCYPNEEYEMAIEALKDRPTGHWIKDTYQSAHCSNCGQIQRTNGKDTTKNCNIHNALFPYCPKCGAKMT